MKRILLVFVILTTVFLSACAVNTSTSAPAINTVTTKMPNSTVIEVTAEALFTAYHNGNKVAGDDEYKGKTIQVSGEAMALGYNSSGIPYIELSGGWQTWSYQLDMAMSSMGVQCCFSLNDESALAQLPLNQNVKIQGQCAGYDFDLDEDNVILDNCSLVK
jgi:tRNA_anti-like